MDMIGGGTTGFGSGATTKIYLWNSQLAYQAPEIQIPMFQYNTMHDGVFDSPTIVPVELALFSASVLNDDVELKWTTASELNNLGFEVQKNINGEFLTIGFKKGFGTTTESHNYSFTDENLETGKYYYRLKQIDFDGSLKYSSSVEIEVLAPVRYSLSQNYPNPFNPSTTISYSIKEAGLVQLKVFDILGNEVASLVDEYKPAGSFEVEFNASQLSSGMYLYKLSAGEFTSVKKFMLLK